MHPFLRHACSVSLRAVRAVLLLLVLVSPARNALSRPFAVACPGFAPIEWGLCMTRFALIFSHIFSTCSAVAIYVLCVLSSYLVYQACLHQRCYVHSSPLGILHALIIDHCSPLECNDLGTYKSTNVDTFCHPSLRTFFFPPPLFSLSLLLLLSFIYTMYCVVYISLSLMRLSVFWFGGGPHLSR